MRCQPECYHCLKGLAHYCATSAVADPQKQGEALEAALSYLDKSFSLNCISTGLAGELQRIIRLKTENEDPFASVKKEEIALALRYTKKYAPHAQVSLRELIKFAARGNGFDFFQDLQSLEKQFKVPVELARDDTAILERMLNEKHAENHKTIVYLADNAGECIFDLPLANRLTQLATVYYAVKGSPVQNDLSLIDLDRNGLMDRFPKVVSTGTDSPGLDLANAAVPFKQLLARADLILAKGMGHYETLPELSLPQPVFLIFQAKCNPIAQDSGLQRYSYAAYFLK